jgi:hypothetical protein
LYVEAIADACVEGREKNAPAGGNSEFIEIEDDAPVAESETAAKTEAAPAAEPVAKKAVAEPEKAEEAPVEEVATEATPAVEEAPVEEVSAEATPAVEEAPEEPAKKAAVKKKAPAKKVAVKKKAPAKKKAEEEDS